MVFSMEKILKKTIEDIISEVAPIVQMQQVEVLDAESMARMKPIDIDPIYDEYIPEHEQPTPAIVTATGIDAEQRASIDSLMEKSILLIQSFMSISILLLIIRQREKKLPSISS